MYAYFDNNTFINSIHLKHDSLIYFQQNPDLHAKLEEAGFKISTNKSFDKFGIYWVGSLGHPINYSRPQHVLHKLDARIISAAREKKVIIVLDSKTEGKPFVQMSNDCFMDLHNAMFKLELPAFSVVIVDGNEHFDNNYVEYLCENRMPRMVHHVPFFDHTFYYTGVKIDKNSLAINNALENATYNNVKDYNSLNRNTRIHRLDHVYYLLKNNLHQQGIVSCCLAMGSNKKEQRKDLQASFNSAFYEQDELKLRLKLLKKYLPLQIDGNWQNVGPEVDPKALFPIDIYKKSLLTVTTETCFHENGMFLTEKTYRPIAAGHPFMILGQYQILKNLKQKGYEIDFYGIDQSYDNIHNIKDRFFAFHKSLQNWCEMPLKVKIECTKKSIPMIIHNLELLKSKNLEKDSYSLVWSTIKEKYGK